MPGTPDQALQDGLRWLDHLGPILAIAVGIAGWLAQRADRGRRSARAVAVVPPVSWPVQPAPAPERPERPPVLPPNAARVATLTDAVPAGEGLVVAQILAGRRSVRDAIVAAEILGPPVALR